LAQASGTVAYHTTLTAVSIQTKGVRSAVQSVRLLQPMCIHHIQHAQENATNSTHHSCRAHLGWPWTKLCLAGRPL